jgi:hypothetical protein
VQLKEEQGLSWDEILDRFPERSKGTLQVHYSSKLKSPSVTSKNTGSAGGWGELKASQVGGRVRRAKDTDDDDVGALSTHSLGACNLAAAATSSGDRHQSDESLVHDSKDDRVEKSFCCLASS